MIGQGVSSRSSYSWAAGRTTSAAKPCAQSRMSFCSWLSASEKVTSWPAEPASASTVASVASEVATADGAGAVIEWISLWGLRGAKPLGTAQRRNSKESTPNALLAKPGRTRGPTRESRDPGHPAQGVSLIARIFANPDLVCGIGLNCWPIMFSMQKVIMNKRTAAIVLSICALALTACGSSSGGSGKSLTLVAYSTPQGAFEKLIP